MTLRWTEILFFLLQYEIIFCIQEAASEELIKMINSLMVKYPSVDAKMVIGKS